MLGESKRKERRSRCNHHVLLAVQFKRDAGRVDGRAQLHMPEVMAGLSVDGDKISVGITGKDHAPEVESAPPLGLLKYGTTTLRSVRASIAFRAPVGRSTGSGT